MSRMRFDRGTDRATILPTSSRARLSSSFVRSSAARGRDCTASSRSRICLRASASITKSRIPTETGRAASHSVTSSWIPSIRSAHASVPKSFAVTWTSPPSTPPSVRLQVYPHSSSPESITTRVSPGETLVFSSSGWSAAKRRRCTGGRSIENSCLPVHRGRGLTIAGTGTARSMRAASIRWHASSNSTNVSRPVRIAAPSSESCTIDITGLLLCGETICVGGVMSDAASAIAS